MERHVRHVIRQTPFLQSPPPPPQQHASPARLCRHEIVTGRVVGTGGFSVVSTVASIVLDPAVSAMLSSEENAARRLLAQSCVDPVTNRPRFVVKHLQEKLLWSAASSSSSQQQGSDPAATATAATTTASVPNQAALHDDDGNNDSNPTSAFAAAAIDLILECEYLRRLHHPNIVRLFGMPVGEGSEAFRQQEGRHDGFFLLLERVDTTLEDAIQAERAEVRVHHQQRQRQRQRQLHHASEALDAKLGRGIQLAAALAHLHSLGIVFRDLKPQNVGLVRGGWGYHSSSSSSSNDNDRVVLLDFGLCRQLPGYDDNSSNKSSTDEAGECNDNRQDGTTHRRPLSSTPTTTMIRGVYHMSAVGTRRYLAVEVVNSSTYNELADVYSWSLVLWEYLALSRPFPHYDVRQHALHVCQQGERPDTGMLPHEVRQLLRQCWTEDWRARLSMEEVVALLTAIVRSHYYDRQRLLHNRLVSLIDAEMEGDEEDDDEREDVTCAPIDLALRRTFDDGMSLSASSLRHPILASSCVPSERCAYEQYQQHQHQQHPAVSPLSWRMLLPSDESQHQAHLGTWTRPDGGVSASSFTTRSMSTDDNDHGHEDLRVNDPDALPHRLLDDDSLALARDGMELVMMSAKRRSEPHRAEFSSSYGTHLSTLSGSTSSSSASSSSHLFGDDYPDHLATGEHELSMSLVADPQVLASSPFDS
jgi:serine/threonine protein kinase